MELFLAYNYTTPLKIDLPSFKTIRRLMRVNSYKEAFLFRKGLLASPGCNEYSDFAFINEEGILIPFIDNQESLEKIP